MKWEQLLSTEKYGSLRNSPDDRNPFQRDFDRIIFSRSFRQLEDKTQVFTQAYDDDVRTRLTHSLEASCVGRSLGTLVGERLQEKFNVDLSPYGGSAGIGAIVSASCLAHDIGNPPFGHAGEDAISTWFSNSELGRYILDLVEAEGIPRADLLNFEGNAQGFRVITRIEHNPNQGGMRLTYATLASFIKYPRGSETKAPSENKMFTKFGFYEDDHKSFQEIAKHVGLLPIKGYKGCFARHPLAFLMEAADDICYNIVDLEDAWKMHLLTFEQVKFMMESVIEYGEMSARLAELDSEILKIECLRGTAISSLINQCMDVFFENYDAIMNGELSVPLTSLIRRKHDFRHIVDMAYENIYAAHSVALIEVAGFNVLGDLLELFLGSLQDVAENGKAASSKSQTIVKVFPDYRKYVTPDTTVYQRVLAVTDYITSMTDRYAVSLFKRLTGISLV